MSLYLWPRWRNKIDLFIYLFIIDDISKESNKLISIFRVASKEILHLYAICSYKSMAALFRHLVQSAAEQLRINSNSANYFLLAISCLCSDLWEVERCLFWKLECQLLYLKFRIFLELQELLNFWQVYQGYLFLFFEESKLWAWP